MGGRNSKDPLAAEINAKRNIALQRNNIPTIEPFEVLAWFGTMSFTGPKISQIIARLKRPRKHNRDFECVCRVTGERKKWHWMTTKECERWVENGDLLVSVAERLIREHHVDDLQVLSGREKLAMVYEILNQQEQSMKICI